MDVKMVPPHDIEAEQAVIGSMLIDKDAVNLGAEALKEEDFYREDNKLIFRAISSLYKKSEPIDIITLKAEMLLQGIFESVGGLEYVTSLIEKVPTTANVEKYIKIVEEKSILRYLIKSASEIIALGYEGKEEVEDIIDASEKKIFSIMEKKSQKGYVNVKDVLVEVFTEIEDLYNKKGNVTGIPTGFIDLDGYMSGLHNSDLILIAARPAIGKSAFALNIAANAAIRAKVPTMVFNLEMSATQMVKRILASESLVNSSKLMTGQLDENDWLKITEGMAEISEAPIYIDETPGISITEIRSKCRKLKSEKNIGLIVIDYLQLIQASGKKNASREQEVSEISRSLKILAKELNIPVIVLSQLNRDSEKRSKNEKKPMLSDLRESGAIEQDADIIMFLYKEDIYTEEGINQGNYGQDTIEIILAKHRAGATGSVKLKWLSDYTKFANLSNR